MYAGGSTTWTRIGNDSPVKLSYCVVNTNGRDLLLRCLKRSRDTHPEGVAAEILVLDNASEDGSAEAVRAWSAAHSGLAAAATLIALERRTGKAENDSALLRQASGEYALLLERGLRAAPGGGGGAARRLSTERPTPPLPVRSSSTPTAARSPAPGGSRDSARRSPGRSSSTGGSSPRDPATAARVGWVQSAAMLVRRSAAEEVGYLDPDFFVYSDETDFQKRLNDAGWAILLVPAAEAVHHEQLASDLEGERRRIVEFHRGRDLYMRKHHGVVAAGLARVLTAWSYLPRALVALVLPGHDPRRYVAHARAAFAPSRGAGLREAAAAWNAGRGGS